MLENISSEQIINKLDDKIDNQINSLLALGNSYHYTIADLNKKVNEDETLEEYIRDTEESFSLPKKELTVLSEDELNSYVKKLDSYWGS